MRKLITLIYRRREINSRPAIQGGESRFSPLRILHREKCFAQSAKFILALIFSICLAGCHMYRPDVQQGNVVTPKQASQLKPGMSQELVKRFLGDPLLINTFTNNRLNYVYTYKHKNLPVTERKIIVTFKNDRLVNIRKSFK